MENALKRIVDRDVPHDCPVCGELVLPDDPTCSRCHWNVRTTQELADLNSRESQLYESRLQEARFRWDSYGDYDQSPMPGPGEATRRSAATSSGNLAIGDELL